MRTAGWLAGSLLALSCVLLVLSCGGDDGPNGPNNSAPSASFTVTPPTGTTSTTFQFDASGSSDAQDSVSVLQVRWDWENDDTWDTPWSTTKTASHAYGVAGTKTIMLEVKDARGLTGNVTRTLTVTGSGPAPEGMVLVPAGTFMMGDGSSYCGADQRLVTLTHGFYLGQHEVTNQEYRGAVQWAYDQGYVTATSSVVNDNLDGSTVALVDLSNSYCQISFDGATFTVDSGREDYPLVAVSWYGAAAYCDWLSMQEGLARPYDHLTWECNGGSPYTAVGYRLPTDAEREYAAQYDNERIYPWGNEAPDCSRVNYSNCVGSTSVVGSYPAAPASLGLYDMAGNVWEWCNDWQTCDLGTSSQTDPTGPGTGLYRVLRGGSWGSTDDYLRCSYRSKYSPSSTFGNFRGFRCVRSQ